MPRSTGIRLRYQQPDEDVVRFFGINLDFLLQAELLLNTVWTDVTMSCFFGGANEMFFTWQVSSLSQETFCITFTRFTSFSRHAEPDRLFSGAEIDVHVIRHNLLPKVSHGTDDLNYFAILIFGLDSVGMDISEWVSCSSLVQTENTNDWMSCYEIWHRYSFLYGGCVDVIVWSLLCFSLLFSFPRVFLCLSSSLLSLHHLHHPLGSFARPPHLSFLRLFPPASSQ